MYTYDRDGEIHRLREERDRRHWRMTITFAVCWIAALVAIVIVGDYLIGEAIRGLSN